MDRWHLLEAIRACVQIEEGSSPVHPCKISTFNCATKYSVIMMECGLDAAIRDTLLRLVIRCGVVDSRTVHRSDIGHPRNPTVEQQLWQAALGWRGRNYFTVQANDTRPTLPFKRTIRDPTYFTVTSTPYFALVVRGTAVRV